MEENTVKPGLFEKGGKLGWLHSTWDAFDTFLRVPATVTAKGAHVRDAVDIKRIMIIVVLAVVPAALFGMWNVGYQHNLAVGDLPGFWNQFFWGLLKVLPLYLVSYIVGLGIEFASAQIKGEEVNEGYLVSGMLIPLIVPVDVPLWMLAIAVAFAVIFGKEVFGGTGMNFLNPALLCRAFLFFSYPISMSGSEVWVAHRCGADAISGATPLSYLTEGQGALEAINNAGYSFWNMFSGIIPGSVGETSVIALLIGTCFLILIGVIDLRIPGTYIVTVILFAGIFGGHGFDPAYLSAQLAGGGLILGAFFMATDYVTRPITIKGQYVYGAVLGLLTGIFRIFGPGAEGVSYAIILGNLLVPLIEKFTMPVAFGRKAGAKREK